MGKITGFLEIDRQDRKNAPASDRVRHFREFVRNCAVVPSERAVKRAQRVRVAIMDHCLSGHVLMLNDLQCVQVWRLLNAQLLQTLRKIDRQLCRSFINLNSLLLLGVDLNNKPISTCANPRKLNSSSIRV